MKPDPKVVVAGSRALPEGVGPQLIADILKRLPDGAVVLLRHPVAALPGQFEMIASAICEAAGVGYEWRLPQITKQHKGRKAVWYRDMDMLADADLCVCFYEVGQIGDEESGTVALVDKALAIDVPVYAYAVTPDNRVIRVGEHDPADTWGKVVPAP